MRNEDENGKLTVDMMENTAFLPDESEREGDRAREKENTFHILISLLAVQV